MEIPVIAEGRLSQVAWAEIETAARNLSEFCKVHVTPDHVMTTRIEPGEIQIRWAAERAAIRLEARSVAALQNLRDTLAHLLDGARAGLAADVIWTAERPVEGSLPPNFREARVLSRRQITPRFVRLRIGAEDLGFMAQSGLHLRLLQPKDAASPRWPRLAANGRTVWPGAEHLHMPVYTVRAIDAAAGWLDVDVFVHGNGPTCAWALAARPGDGLGISGPGGGTVPDAPELCLGGDETALPVIARILAEAAPDSRGVAMIEVEDEEEVQPLAHPDGVSVHWLCRGRDATLRSHYGAAMRAALSDRPDTAVLFGGEKADAQSLRAELKPQYPRLPQNVSLAAYWARG